MIKKHQRSKRQTAAQKFAASGGRARAAKLTPERLSEIGRDAANARWERVRKLPLESARVTPETSE